MSEWIKTSERMPPEHESVLVYYHRPSIQFPHLHFMTESSFYNGRFEIEYHVTHWMPLPQPPQE